VKFSELDTVRANKDVLEEGIKKGEIGTIICAFTYPNEAYEVEFIEDVYNPKFAVFLPDEIEKYEVKWLFVLDPIGDKEISEVEDILGIRFPNDYKEWVKKHHGGSPKPSSFDFKDRKGAVFNNLLTFDRNDKYDYIVEVRNIVEGMVESIYPFAADPFGNFICFDFRGENSFHPKVVFWDHEVADNSSEKGISYICDNFTDLRYKLYNPE